MIRTSFTLAVALVFASQTFAQDAAPTEAPAPTAAPAADAPAPTPAPTPAPAAEPATTEPAAEPPAAKAPPPPDRGSDEPSIAERRVVAYVASGASIVALGVGVTMGVLAQQQFGCLEDVIACNADLEGDAKIEGSELLDARAEVEHKALIADMMYLVAGAAAVVAATGFIRGYVMTGEESDASAEASLGINEPRVAVGGAR